MILKCSFICGSAHVYRSHQHSNYDDDLISISMSSGRRSFGRNQPWADGAAGDVVGERRRAGHRRRSQGGVLLLVPRGGRVAAEAAAGRRCGARGAEEPGKRLGMKS